MKCQENRQRRREILNTRGYLTNAERSEEAAELRERSSHASETAKNLGMVALLQYGLAIADYYISGSAMPLDPIVDILAIGGTLTAFLAGCNQYVYGERKITADVIEMRVQTVRPQMAIDMPEHIAKIESIQQLNRDYELNRKKGSPTFTQDLQTYINNNVQPPDQSSIE